MVPTDTRRTSRRLISMLPSSVNWRRRSFRLAMFSNRVRRGEWARRIALSVGRSGQDPLEQRDGTRQGAGRFGVPDQGRNLALERLGTEPSRAMLRPERSDPRRIALGRAGYGDQPEERGNPWDTEAVLG